MKILLTILISFIVPVISAPIETDFDRGLDTATDTGFDFIVACHLKIYVKPTQDKIMHGLFYLNGVKGHGEPEVPKSIWGITGKTRMMSCSGRTAFYLILDAHLGLQGKPQVKYYYSEELGHKLDAAYHYCYDGPPSDKEKPIPAYQIWGLGWSIIVAGQAECAYMGFVKDSERDFRYF